MAGSSASWSGGLEFAGFPISVKLFPLVGSTRNDSFRMLAPTDHKPVIQKLVDTKGRTVDRDKTLKGVEDPREPGKFVALNNAALDAIALRERTKIAAPKKFSPRASVPFLVGQGTYMVVPEDGSEQAVQIIWNGLADGDLVYVTEMTMRAGAPDSIVVIHAEADGHLYATKLPYMTQLKPVNAPQLAVDKKQAKVFATFVDQTYEVAEFDHADYVSEHKQRRDAAIKAALAGETYVAPEGDVEAPPEVPDLMATLEAAISEAKRPPKRAAKKPAKKAVKA